MKILTLLGFLVLFTTNPMTDCIPGQFQPQPIPYYFPAPVVKAHSGVGSIFGFLVLVIILSSIPIRPRKDCPLGYTLYSSKCGQLCYRFETQKCRSWNNARAACQAEGADLLEPDKCSYPFFQRLAKQKKAKTCDDLWIGGFRIPPMINYMTVGGAPLPDNFPFWAGGQPDRIGSRGSEQACVQMSDELDFLMNDDGCSELTGYICQRTV